MLFYPHNNPIKIRHDDNSNTVDQDPQIISQTSWVDYMLA